MIRTRQTGRWPFDATWCGVCTVDGNTYETINKGYRNEQDAINAALDMRDYIESLKNFGTLSKVEAAKALRDYGYEKV